MNGVKGLGSTLGSVAGTGLKIFNTAVATAATGVAALTTSAVKNYAEYEQLVGGIETLFGTGGAKTVQEYANQVGKSVSEVQDEFDMLMKAQTDALNNANAAYETAGLSANDYMETVTGFAASLKQSTKNEVEAAEAANQAVIDMADNANKMGSSMESIQNAYQGFAKQNYTMLDNLKLGYGGTKEEMARLLEDAEKLSGVKYDINNLNDVYSAIHVIQTELGITGTTAREASSTISGSLNMTKAAWSNLLTGIADDNADFDTLVNDFVDSVGVAAENILPRVEVAISGAGQLIESLVPIIINKIPEIVNNVVPDLLQSGVNIINSLVDGIGSSSDVLIDALVDICMSLVTSAAEILPDFLQVGLQVISQLAIGIAQALPDLIPTIVEILLDLVETLLSNMDLILDAAMQLIMGLADGLINSIPLLIERLPSLIQSIVEFLVENVPILIEGAITLFMALVDAIPVILDALIENLPLIINCIIDGMLTCIPMLLEAAIKLFMALVEAIPEIVVALAEALPQIIEAIVNTLGEWVDKLIEWLAENLPGIIENFVQFFSELPGKIWEWLVNVVKKILEWRKDMIDKAKEIASGFVQKVIEFIKELPGKIWNWFKNVVSKVVEFRHDLIEKAKEIGAKFVSNIVDFIKGLPDKLKEMGSNIVSGLWNGINKAWSSLVKNVGSLASGLIDGVKDIFGIHSPSKEFEWIGKMCVAGFDEPIEDYNPYDTLQDSMEANVGSLKASFASATQGTYASFSIDYDRMGQEMRNAVKDMAVDMDGQTVGRIVTPTVNSELVDYENRRI